MNDDEQLLRQYAEHQSEPAFSELVARHIDLVYSVAVRLVGGDAHLAQDVVQTVFTDLSRKAKTLPGGVFLAGWLHRHTFFVASTMVRKEQRRRHHEQQAVEMNTLDDSNTPKWEQLAPFLDEALQGLGTMDRHALVLRFLQGRDLKSVGAALGTNENAAQKRVSRALEKLRSCLLKRGLTLTATTIAAALTSHAVTAAPVGMAAQVTASILAGAGTSSGTAITWIKFMVWLKTKTAVVSTATILLTGVTTTYLLQRESDPPVTTTQQQANTPTPVSTNALVSVAGSPNGRFGFHWSQVESSDYRQYIANLRAIGCPEQTIRDVIIADVNQSFSGRAQAILNRSVKEYWQKNLNTSPNPNQLQQLMALDREKAAILKTLLGISYDAQHLTDLVFCQLRATEAQLAFLSPEKREAMQKVLSESGFNEKLERMRAVNPHADPDRIMFTEKLKCLAKVLSPEELDLYRMHLSPRAQWLRNDVNYFHCAPEEFRALLELREKHLGGDRENLTVDRAIAIEQVRTLLGEERAREYEQVSDMGYTNARSAAEQAGLPNDLAHQAGLIAYEARVSVEKVATNSHVSVEERIQQVRAIHAQAQTRLRTELGQYAVPGVCQVLRQTLDNTAQRIRP